MSLPVDDGEGRRRDADGRNGCTQNMTLTRFNASSHACFMSDTLALFTLTSSRSTSAAVVVVNSPDMLPLALSA